MKKITIIGAGISGCSAASLIAGEGHQVTLIEKESVAGGKVLDYCCKATDSCSRCGVCVAHTRIYETLSHPNVTLLTGTEIGSSTVSGGGTALQGSRKKPAIDYQKCELCGDCVAACPEGAITRYQRGELVQFYIDYSKCLLHKGKSCSACADACASGAIIADTPSSTITVQSDAVMVAAGHSPFPAEQKPRYGYSRSDKVITGAEAEEILSRQESLNRGKDIAFIQCVGSRDPVIGRNYCSAVCCSYALRLARIIKYREPDTAVTIYYIDIQNFDKEYSLLRKEIESMGVRFQRGLPFRIDEVSGGKLRFTIENMDGDESVVDHDMAVLSVGMGAAEKGEETAEVFSLSRDEFGFYNAGGPVFVAGTCREPQAIPEVMVEARSAAVEMIESFGTE